MTGRNEWPDGEIARLRGVWDEGLSTAEIGRRLGRSKNSIVGKAHRLNLPPRPSPIGRGPTSSEPRRPRRLCRGAVSLDTLASLKPGASVAIMVPTAKRVRSQPFRIGTAPIAPVQTAAARPAVKADAAVAPAPAASPPAYAPPIHICRFPIGDPHAKSFRFCDDVAEFAHVYCTDHCRLSYINWHPKAVPILAS